MKTSGALQRLNKRRLNRRTLLTSATLAVCLPQISFGVKASRELDSNTLDLQRQGERYSLNLGTKEGYETAAWLLRDVQANEMGYPSPELLLLAAQAQAALNAQFGYTVFEVTSGLRTPKTNAATEGAAAASRHLPDADGVFYAMDFIPHGANGESLFALLANQQGTGVGLYNSHVHLDVRNKAAAWRR